jgi:hypothetical protein
VVNPDLNKKGDLNACKKCEKQLEKHLAKNRCKTIFAVP